MIDFKKFYNAKFYDQHMNPIEITDASLEVAATSEFMAEYDFSQVPDLPFRDLVNQLILDLPEGFTFIKTNPSILNVALETSCNRLRSDIKFIEPYGDIDSEWYEWALPALLLNNSQSVHELYTAWKLTKDDVPCGLVGPSIGLNDFGVMTKTTSGFNATEPNWQIVNTYKIISARLLAEYCTELVHPNFTLLLTKAFLKLLDVEKNWLLFRTLTANRFFPINFALALEPCSAHDFKSIANQTDYPRYPGLVNRETIEIFSPVKGLV